MPKLQTKEVFQTKLTHSFVCVFEKLVWLVKLSVIVSFLHTTTRRNSSLLSPLYCQSIEVKRRKETLSYNVCVFLFNKISPAVVFWREESPKMLKQHAPLLLVLPNLRLLQVNLPLKGNLLTAPSLVIFWMGENSLTRPVCFRYFQQMAG